ncbi:hypothetical protein [Leisingera sp. M658]|nr:hypothetical protein [Leisingera sp. M658]UWQ73335.1 hypothetical protein K3724_12225 [Leisingera sp. M658]
MSKPPLPQSGGSFIRQPDGKLKQVEKPAADPKPKAPAPAKPARKEKEA